MEIKGLPPTPPNLTATLLPQLQELRIGQLLQAVVIRQINAQTVLLQVLNATDQTAPGQPPQPSQPQASQQSPQTPLLLQLKAETPMPLAVGQRLQLEVSQLSEKPILKVLNQTATAEPVVKNALMQALPRQSGLAPLLANLVWITQQQSPAVPLPQAIQTLAKELFEKLPSRDKITTAEGVKEAIKESGIFLEGKLSQAAQKGTTPETGNDLKNLLLRLFSTVQKEQTQTAATTASQTPTRPATVPSTPVMPQTPPAIPGGRPQPQREAQPTLPALATTLALLQELGNQTEGSIARTQLHQLASLPTPEQNPLTWSFELPIRNQERIDLFQFIIEEQRGERDKKDKEQRRWSITIAFELEGLGPMYARLQLENGKVGATFWADSYDTTNLINQNLPELAQRFEQAGLERGELRCFQGQPPEPASTPIPRLVLDLKA